MHTCYAFKHMTSLFEHFLSIYGYIVDSTFKLRLFLRIAMIIRLYRLFVYSNMILFTWMFFPMEFSLCCICYVVYIHKVMRLKRTWRNNT